MMVGGDYADDISFSSTYSLVSLAESLLTHSSATGISPHTMAGKSKCTSAVSLKARVR
jgi:hypothetical protein